MTMQVGTGRGVAAGRAIEVAASLCALAMTVYGCRRFGVTGTGVTWFLVAVSPLVGEFAMTMAYRYRPGMTTAQAAARLVWPSRCDSCAIGLSQWDILPVVPYVVRRGRCACGAFRVPADCTLAGLATLALAAAVAVGATLAGVDPLAPVALGLAFAPVVVGDLMHGEVDGPLLGLPLVVAPLLMPHPWWVGPAMAALLVANLWVSSLLTRLFVDRGVLPTGIRDLAIVGVAGLYLSVQDAVNATVWLLVGLVLSHGAVRLLASPRVRAALRLGPPRIGRYGPDAEPGSEGALDGLAAPQAPALVFSAVMGLVAHLV